MIESSNLSQWQVFWQQAWASEKIDSVYVADNGLRNTAFVRTESNSAESGDFVWGVNSLSEKAVGRLQIPNLNPVPNEDFPQLFGWKNPYDNDGNYDLFDGEVYWDAIQQGVVCRMANGWYMLHQPERILASLGTSPFGWSAGDEKNLVYTGIVNFTINLPTDRDLVAPGTVVRIMFQPTSATLAHVTVDYGGTSSLSMNVNTAAEFVFYDSGSSGEWLVTQSNTSSPH